MTRARQHDAHVRARARLLATKLSPLFDTVTIVVNKSQGEAAVPGWAKHSYGIGPEQIADVEYLASDGYHETYRVQYRKLNEGGQGSLCPDCDEWEDACRCESARNEWEALCNPNRPDEWAEPDYVADAVHAALEDLTLDQQIEVIEDVLAQLREQKIKKGDLT